MIAPALREFKLRLNHHIRFTSDTNREPSAGLLVPAVRCQGRPTPPFAEKSAHATPALARPKQPVAIREP